MLGSMVDAGLGIDSAAPVAVATNRQAVSNKVFLTAGVIVIVFFLFSLPGGEDNTTSSGWVEA